MNRRILCVFMYRVRIVAKNSTLNSGDGSTPFGLKWEKSKPETVYYLCEHNGCVIRQSELDQKSRPLDLR
ncbi:terminase [Salmonella enterica subsp. enterica]|nr:terminase [Salmonella enterica subsp. enterica]